MINERFTLILGRLKKSSLDHFKEEFDFNSFNDYEFIPIEKFVNIFQYQTEEFKDLEKLISLLDLINEYQTILNNNSQMLSDFINLIDSLNQILQINLLLQKKEKLLKELELSKINKSSSELNAISNLMKKLEDSINDNKKKLNYLEQDFLNRKDQIDKIKKDIENYNLKINELNNDKKECFNQINKITREMDGLIEPKDNNLKLRFGIETNLKSSEKIKFLQKEAKDIQFQINKIKIDLNKKKKKYEELKPYYELYLKDHQNLIDQIKIDQDKLINLQNEYKEKIKSYETTSSRELFIDKDMSIKNPNEIEAEIQIINVKIKEEQGDNLFLNKKNPQNLNEISKKFIELKEDLNLKQNENIIRHDQKEVLEIFENFWKFEELINQLEKIINIFLVEINIKVNFHILIDENKDLFIRLDFARVNNQNMNFEALTTPEKIFFIITFYLSIKILKRSEITIFSNLFLPTQYNKRGSLFRTIKKIIPIFQMEKTLSNFKLIFIISNLEMKKEIKDLAIINLDKR